MDYNLCRHFCLSFADLKKEKKKIFQDLILMVIMILFDQKAETDTA